MKLARIGACWGVLLSLVLSGCAPAPRHNLTAEEKVADLYWLYSVFGEYYAPLSYKEQKYSYQFADLKARYLAEAPGTTSNEEFYGLMYRFVSEFKDAHTSASMMSAATPGRTNVAYLGFSGQRKGGAVIVKKLLPTISSDSAYPIKVGDKITKLDGVALADVVRAQSLSYRNLGSDEANLTYHMPELFFRNSIQSAMPVKDTAVLTVVRGEKETEITLPWVVKDLITFTAEQAQAAKKDDGDKKKKDPQEKKSDDGALNADEWTALLQIGSLTGANVNPLVPSMIARITHAIPGVSFWNSFVFVDARETWTSSPLKSAIREAAQRLNLKTPLLDDPVKTGVDGLKEARNVPENVLFVSEAKTYPTYIVRKKTYDSAGKETGQQKLVAYMYVDTFSPTTAEADVLKELKATLKTLQANGVKDVVIDLLNNGGGSLTLGAMMVQAFSSRKITLPDMQFGLNETWLDDFENASLQATSDSEKELAGRVFKSLKKERDAGLRLSSRHNLESLMPYQVQPNTDLESELNIVLAVNEMCASMCDIFTAMMKDNHLAKVVGANTMGAGGNVVQINEGSPNGHFYVRQTESLIVRADGSYIENNGVAPDVALAVNEAAGEKYDSVIAKAFEQITGAPAADDSGKKKP